ncbi:GNAT family N-acetyltransferase [Edaphobacter aggregans]|uniref:GNAT family N-acetyltransferase n=1 Tax=Edaphobacter aggregans TaxID=570835 RepID=UPI00146FC90F|nr:GNAT family N-acetyltransferase [Edaphobacter aggregans]
MVLRRYERRDLESIVALDAECFAPPFRFSREAMRRFAEAENAWAVIAEAGDALAGFCIVHIEPAEAVEVGYVVTIDVGEGFRRRGLGERMLAEGEAWVRASGGVGMMLHVYVKNAGAVRFYERLGYRRVGGQKGFYGPGVDAAMYWKEFES